MKIEVYCLAHNEERMMPYFMRHYGQFAKVVILENNSTDNTVAIARSYGARVWEYDIPNEINDQWYIDVKDSCWKASRADWVMVVDTDEFIYHPEILRILAESKATLIQPVLYEMFTDTFPTTTGQIYDEVKTGCNGGPKVNIFRPSEIKNINYQAGCHFCTPEGNIKLDMHSGISTLHMRFLSKQYIIERNAMAAKRLSEWNKEKGLGFHYLWSPEEITKHFDNHFAASRKVI